MQNNDTRRTHSPDISNQSQARVSVNTGGSTFWDAIEYHKQESQPLHSTIQRLTEDRDDLIDALKTAEADYDDLQRRLLAFSQKRHFATAVVAVAGGVLLTLGGIAGWTLHPDAGSQAPEVAKTVAGPTVTVTPTTDRLDDVLPPPAPDAFSTLSCSKGKWVVFLESAAGKYADRIIVSDLREQRARAKNLLGDSAPEMVAGRYSAICPAALGGYISKADPSRYFIWVGPVETEASATRLCSRLLRPASWDCLVHKIA